MFKTDLLLIRIRKLAALLADPVFRRAFCKHGVAPAIEHIAVLRSLSFDYVADVGANRGQFSLICRRLRPGAAIVAFEPLAEPAAVYRAVFADDHAVRLHQCALGPQRGEVAMNVSGHDDSSSLLPISDIQTKNFPGTGTVATRIVAVGPLSDFVQPSELGRRNLLKIDVQGFELEVLKSAEALLPRFCWIYAECSFVPLYEGQALADEIITWLAARNFRLRGRFNPSYGQDRMLLQADLLFDNDRSSQAASLATNQS
jgi:FkbM family methyltransferase